MADSIVDQFAPDLHALIKLQRTAYEADGFPSAAVRIDRLRRMLEQVLKNKEQIIEAISQDFGHRSRGDTELEVLSAVVAFRTAIENVGTWMKPERYPALTPDADAHVEYIPLGVVGIIGPWNYPLTLVLGPLAGILAAGNRAIAKPSEITPKFSNLLARLVSEAFTPDEVAVVLGDSAAGAAFSAAPFDHLIFTGSTSVARHVMRAAADNLTPVTLELGGKSPVIVTDQFDLAEAAARIMTVKTRNAGQICLAPDYVFVPAGLQRAFVEACVSATRTMFPEGVASSDYTTIITDRHFQRLTALVEDARAKGAEVIEVLPPSKSVNDRRFPPTLILGATDDMTAMQEEIFGPVLPVVSYGSLDAVLKRIRSGPRPLALYYFGQDDETARKVLDGTASGGGVINDVMTHAFADDLPFGGIGASGMGAYHGVAGFRTFSHARAVYRQSKRQEVATLFRAPFGENLKQFVEHSTAEAKGLLG